jgi:hypothetical protein
VGVRYVLVVCVGLVRRNMCKLAVPPEEYERYFAERGGLSSAADSGGALDGGGSGFAVLAGPTGDDASRQDGLLDGHQLVLDGECLLQLSDELGFDLARALGKGWFVHGLDVVGKVPPRREGLVAPSAADALVLVHGLDVVLTVPPRRERLVALRAADALVLVGAAVRRGRRQPFPRWTCIFSHARHTTWLAAP